MPHAAPLLPSAWESYAAQLARIEYTAIACVVLKLRRPLTPHFWLNVHDEHIPFNGVIEFSNLNPQCAGGDHLLYVPYYTPLDSPVYAASDSALLDSTWECLRRINLTLKREDLLGYGIFRDPCAQPICPVGFSKYAPHCHSPIHGLHFLESTFLYPEDRSLSGLLAHARSCAQDIHAAHLHG